MDGLEEKLGAVLSNPQLMQQIMSMAKAMDSQTPPPPQAQEVSAPALPDMDPGMLRKLMGSMGQTGVDQNQKALLQALHPYLSRDRLSRLERAMRAAKMAKLASSLLGSGGLLSHSGR